VIVGKGVEVRKGVLVVTIKLAMGSGDDTVARSGSKADMLEQQLAATINRDNNNKYLIGF
jgi:hypothetical protein